MKNIKGKDCIGKFVVMRSKAFARSNGPIPINTNIVDEHNKEIMPYGVFRIETYKPVNDPNYKISLIPIGPYQNCMHDQDRYSDIVKEFVTPQEFCAAEKEPYMFILFEDPIYAYMMSLELTQELYPEFVELINRNFFTGPVK